MSKFTPWSTLKSIVATTPGLPFSWIPQEEAERVFSYAKYEALYWNDPTQFSLRVLEGEEAIYIPNAKVIVDTTSHYLLKGLRVFTRGDDSALSQALTSFLSRELFYSRFQAAKHTGVVRGDFVLHLTANPNKIPGTRISLNSVDPSRVFPIYDDDAPDKLIRCHIIDIWKDNNDGKEYVKKLTYNLVEENNTRRVSSEEALYEMTPQWWGTSPELKKTLLPYKLLDPAITAIPVYWFKNLAWDGWPYGSSELKGLETLLKGVSQGSSDVQGALSLEGLGVYATDGGRPVDNDGNEIDWEIAPGRVMEVTSGSYFRRVEGVSSITPATDQISYLERKVKEAAALSDVALGTVDVKTAQSGIALSIRFLPTMAKMEQRDQAGVGKLNQLFFDWKNWYKAYELADFSGDIFVEIGDKLPSNRTEKLNELNNMVDRKIISTKFYREEMKKLGYVFPSSIEKEIAEDIARVQLNITASPTQLDTATLSQGNQSNNVNRTNESNGTEAPTTAPK